MITIKLTYDQITNFSKPYFIADIGANHDGDIKRAFKLIEKAKESGANAVKFQNFKANKIVSKFGFENLGKKLTHQSSWKKSVYETYLDASLNDEWNLLLKEKCDQVNIEYLTSPYDIESVDNVDKLLKIFKIGSGDLTWPEIVKYISSKNKPVILATGACTLNEVIQTMKLLKNNKIVLMQCNTNYSANYDNFKYINLNVLKSYKKKFPNVILGLSDHTFGHSTVLGALALGARVFEKHFTDDNNRNGPDHKFAMNPLTWKLMVKSSIELYHALGNGEKCIEKNEKEASVVQRRCIRIKQDTKKNTIIKKEDIECLRPAPNNSIPPYLIKKVIGKTLKYNKKEGDYIKFTDLK